MWKHKQPVQCKNCPWKVSSDLSKISEYNEDMHRDLAQTIRCDNIQSGEDLMQIMSSQPRLMTCHMHEASDGLSGTCIGYLLNQAQNNNISVRIALMNCENSKDMKTVGEQFPNYEATLPENRPKK